MYVLTLTVLLTLLTLFGAVQGGLFSAVLTAFNVQSYQLLTPPPVTDPVIIALERISAQLSSFSVNPPSVNSTHPAFVYHNPTPLPAPRYAVWLNALWFASLIFSLSAASIGIMVKQWLNEYSTGLSGNSRQIARLRQLRLNGLRRWRVKEIVSFLPVLLQIASALFFAGLLVLLWQLNPVVAIVATVLIGLLAIFSLATTILPSIVAGCAYLSPTSKALYELTPLLKKFIYGFLIGCFVGFFVLLKRVRKDPFLEKHSRVSKLLNSLKDRFGGSGIRWHGRELHIIAKKSDKLDCDSITAAYSTSMDTNYLSHAAICVTEVTMDAARKCFREIRSTNIAHWGQEHTHVMQRSVHPFVWTGTFIALMDAATQDSSTASSSIKGELHGLNQIVSSHYLTVSNNPSYTPLVGIDLVHIIHHYNQLKLPFGPISATYGLPYLMLGFASESLGNNIRRQGECTNTSLDCSLN